MQNVTNTRFSRIGAYELKASYQRNMLVSTLVTALIAMAAVLFFTSDNSEATPIEPISTMDTIWVSMSLPPPINVVRPSVPTVKRYSDIVDGIPTPVPDDELPDDFDDRGIATKDDRYALVDGQFDASNIGDGDIVIYDPPDNTEYPAISDVQFVEIYPSMVYEEPPVFPRLARTAGMEADVWIKALVDVDGTVVRAVVYKSSKSKIGFDRAAVDAALQCKYSPGIQNGIPVPVWVCYKVEFRLERSR